MGDNSLNVRDGSEFQYGPKLISKQIIHKRTAITEESYNTFALKCKKEVRLTKGQVLRIEARVYNKKIDMKKDNFNCFCCNKVKLGIELDSMGVCDKCNKEIM